MKFYEYINEVRSTMKKNFTLPDKFMKYGKVKSVYSDNMGIVWAKLPDGSIFQIGTLPSRWDYDIESWFQNNQKIVVKLKKRKIKGPIV